MNTVMRSLLTFVMGISLLVSQAAMARELPDFTQLAAQNGPMVVNISTKQKQKHPRGRMPHGLPMPELPEGSPWEDMFKHFFGGPDNGPDTFEARSLGSGFILDRDGYILTNHHVVNEADEIIVRLNDRRELEAELIGSDARSDIALLKIDAKDLPTVKLGKSEQLRVGEWVMAIGSPFGFDSSVSVGVVSALGRSLPSETYVPFIQTDVAINPGNSGGPLFNLDGEVVGINSQIYSRTGGFMGLSFAIPIDVAMDVVNQLKDKGYVARGWLGVLIQDVTRELAESFDMKKPTGALVAKVVDNSPAGKAGIEVGDIIVEFDGKAVNDSSDLPPLVGRTPIGKKAPVKVIRNGKTRMLKVEIAELPEEEELTKTSSKPAKSTDNRLEMVVKDLDREQRKALDIKKGGVVVTDIEPDGPAYAAGIREGDVIVKFNNQDVEGAKQFTKLVKGVDEGKSVPVLVQRRGGPIFMALKMPED